MRMVFKVWVPLWATLLALGPATGTAWSAQQVDTTQPGAGPGAAQSNPAGTPVQPNSAGTPVQPPPAGPATQPGPGDEPVRPPAPSGALSLSIDDVIQQAEAGSESVTVARAGVQRAEAEQIRARSEWFPQINGTATYDRTLKSEYSYLTEDTSGSSGGTNPFADLPFGQANTYRLGLSLSENLYSGGRTINRQIMALSGLESAKIGMASARAEAVLGVVQAYYDAVLSEQLLAIAEATLKRAQETLELTRLNRETGNIPEFDLLRAQVTFENQKPAVLQQRYARDQALLRLKQLLDLPLNRPLELTSSLEDAQSQSVAANAQKTAGVPELTADRPRAIERQAEVGVAVREALVRTARSQHRPTVSLTSSLGVVAYPDGFFPALDDWRTNWTVGLALQVPIFTGFRIRGDVLSAQADLIEARARLKQTRELAHLDTESAREQLASAQATWEASAGTVSQAQRAYQIADLRYREGVSTQLELSDSRILLQQAQANRARAARDVQVARIRLALLTNLPVMSVASGAGGAGMTEASSSGSQLSSSSQQASSGASGAAAY